MSKINLPSEFPQLGSCDPAGVYAMPQKDCFRFGSLVKSLGSFGLLVVGPPPGEPAPEPEPELEPEEVAEEPLFALFLLFLDTTTPTVTPMTISAARPSSEPMSYCSTMSLRQLDSNVCIDAYDPLCALPARWRLLRRRRVEESILGCSSCRHDVLSV